MSNRIKKMQKRLNRNTPTISLEKDPTVMVHGAMTYQCQSCNKRWRMWLEKGLEDREQNKIDPKSHKPVPFTIRCKCGGWANHVDWNNDIHLDGYRPIADHMSYFKNDPNSDCGVPVVRGEI